MQKSRICLGIERVNGTFAIIEREDTQVTPVMQEAAEALFHTLATGERELPAAFYDWVARAFHTDRTDAKTRLAKAMYGGKTAP